MTFLIKFFTKTSSQPDNVGSKSIVRNENEQILRKPLKMKKAINERNTRVIPVVNHELWNILSRRAKNAYQCWKKKSLGSDSKSDYLLFDGVTQSTSMLRLKQAFENLIFNTVRGTVADIVEEHFYMERQVTRN